MTLEKIIKKVLITEKVESSTKKTLQDFAKQAQVFLDAGLKLKDLWDDVDNLEDENLDMDNEISEDYPFDDEFDSFFGGPTSSVNEWVASIKKFVNSVK